MIIHRELHRLDSHKLIQKINHHLIHSDQNNCRVHLAMDQISNPLHIFD